MLPAARPIKSNRMKYAWPKKDNKKDNVLEPSEVKKMIDESSQDDCQQCGGYVALSGEPLAEQCSLKHRLIGLFVDNEARSLGSNVQPKGLGG